MQLLSLIVISSLFFLGSPVLSHGGNSDCSEECDSSYCPNEDSNKKNIKD